MTTHWNVVLAAGTPASPQAAAAQERRELIDLTAERDLRFGRLALARDGQRVAFSDHDGQIYIWDWRAREPLVTLPGHTRAPPWQAAVQDLAFTPDGKQILSAGSDQAIRLWDVATWQVRATCPSW